MAIVVSCAMHEGVILDYWRYWMEDKDWRRALFGAKDAKIEASLGLKEAFSDALGGRGS